MLTIQGVRCDDPARPYIIAEASGNHGQELAQAVRLVQAAAEAGADAIKFQTFTPEDICADLPILLGHDAAHDAWCARLGVTRLRALFAKGGLPRAWHGRLKRVAEDCGVAFLSTPFSVDAARFLVEEIGVPALKIASGDLTFRPLLTYAAQTGLPLLVSTGGATMGEILQALRVLSEAASPGTVAPLFLHCVSAYPCPEAAVNLAALRSMRLALHEPLGFSDHTLSCDLVPALAVALGATVLEKHLRLADDTQSVDAGHAVDPEAFATYVATARRTPALLGDGRKLPHPAEQHDRLWARRSPTDWLRPTDAARAGRWA